jgi:hypothetical protein
MPVIVGVGRSGTTLLRLMLDSHPEVAIPPETGFLPEVRARSAELDAEGLAGLLVGARQWPDFHLNEGELRAALERLDPFSPAAGTRCFYRLYARRFGKPRWGDKTPVYARHMPAIQELLPEARFVHLIRDGRDVALSLRPLWFAPGRDARTLGAYWREGVEAARRDAPRCRHYLEVRFEELVAAPERVLARVCDFLDLAWSPAMLAYPERAAARLGEVEDQRQPGGPLVTREQRLGQHPHLGFPPRADRVGRWRREMSADEVADFAAVAGDLLAALGYEGGSG